MGYFLGLQVDVPITVGGGVVLISRSLWYVHHYISILYILCVISHLIKAYVTLLGLTCKHTS